MIAAILNRLVNQALTYVNGNKKIPSSPAKQELNGKC
jgi:hypothetical protein